MDVVVAGGGIGGFACALALAKTGARVRIIERAAKLGEAGAGLQLSPNAMKALAMLGVADALAGQGVAPPSLQLRLGKSGGKVFSIDMRDAAKRHGAPYLHVHRADLLEALRAAAVAAGVGVTLGAAVCGLQRQDSGARVGLDNGQLLDCHLLVGADGLRSTVRQMMFGVDAPRFTGDVAWRFVVPAEASPDLPPGAVVWAGAGRHAVTYRLRGGSLINFVGVISGVAEIPEVWEQGGDPRELVQAFDGWATPLTQVISAASNAYRWPLYDRDSMPTWRSGHAVLLGDAAHAMPPYLAQGAAMALEDAVILSRCLQDVEIAHGLRRYEQARRARTAKVLEVSRNNGKIFHRRSFAGRLATYAPMMLADRIAPALVGGRLDWLYDYDPATVKLPA